MKKYQPLTNATFVDSVVVYIYLHCMHILLEYILLYLLFDAFFNYVLYLDRYVYYEIM